MKKVFSAGIAGLIFGFGLTVSGMLDPMRVIDFLDITGGAWDPTLVFVLAGAVGVTAIGYGLVTKRAAPIYDAQFALPPTKEVDARLFGGAAMFGVGWGVVGYCPGPAIASIGFAGTSAAIFCLAMVGGMLLHRMIPEKASASAQ